MVLEWFPIWFLKVALFVRTSTSLKKRVEFPFRCIHCQNRPKRFLQAMTQRRLQSLGKNLLPAHLRAIVILKWLARLWVPFSLWIFCVCMY
jgi:hypothetical protein